MSRSGQPPDLKKYMDKKLQIKLNANRMVVGTLRGFDQFMNLVVDNTVDVNGNEKTDIGMVVIRGNSVVTVEALEPVSRAQTLGPFPFIPACRKGLGEAYRTENWYYGRTVACEHTVFLDALKFRFVKE
ncbi:hypothetical protein Pint_11306 [Pistacia integerrima]|uniref:Uncharacterized protein n=1 Tax=Pistacia integerrima TaxID=434235 RepID=A0ACC0XEW7_9ROSI|nr:hypothetical protein Pint_11306 [Pistacia integerrima]